MGSCRVAGQGRRRRRRRFPGERRRKTLPPPPMTAHVACDAGDAEGLRRLLEEHGADPNSRDASGATPLHVVIVGAGRRSRNAPARRDCGSGEAVA